MRALFWTHKQIIDALNIPEQTYYYHWRKIKHENEEIYTKMTEQNISEDVERTISGLEHKIQELQGIIDKPESQDAKMKAIEIQAQLMAAIPKVRQQGASYIETVGFGYTNTRKREESPPVE